MAKNKTIAIDIGHGVDTFPPSKGVYKGGKGYAEHSFNSKLGVALEKELKDRGFKTVLYQKPNAKDVPLKQRTDYYNAQKVDLVFSVHANYNGDSNVNGRCVFYWGTSKQSKRLAEIIAKRIKDAGYSTHGNGLHAGERGSWTNLHINRETNMPAVLVENGFMSGSKDFDLVFGSKQAGYVKDMAKIHADSISDYFGVKEGGTSKPAPSKPAPKPSKPKKKTIAQMAAEVSAGKHGNGHDARRKSLGISKAEYEKVRAEVNRKAGVSKPKPAPKPKPKPKPANIKAGSKVTLSKSAKKYATGENIPSRFKGGKFTVQQVSGNRALLKEIFSWVLLSDIGGGTASPYKTSKSISQMATEVIAGKHGNGNDVRRKSLGISQAEYNKVRAEVNRRA